MLHKVFIKTSSNRLEVKHSSAKTQESKGLVPLTLETGKIMWIHRPRPGRTMGCEEIQFKREILQFVSILPDDSNLTSASLSDSEGEKHACTAQADVPQLTGARSEKSYLKQYEKVTDETRQQTMLVQTSLPAPMTRRRSRKKSGLIMS